MRTTGGAVVEVCSAGRSAIWGFCRSARLLYFAAVQQDLGSGDDREPRPAHSTPEMRASAATATITMNMGGAAMRWWRKVTRRRRCDTPQSEELRYRLTPLQRMIPGLGAPIGILGAQVTIWANGEGLPTGHELWDVIRVAIGVPAALFFLSRPYGVTITPSAVIVHSPGRRTIKLIDIRFIRVENYLGSQTIVIYDASGRRTRLRAPITGPLYRDRQFWTKFHTIGQWWLDHGGPGPADAVPAPPP